MLSVFKLAEAMNEAATGNFQSNVEAHVFYGTMDECTSEMGFALLSEQADLMTFSNGVDEIMTEAAMKNPDSLDVLSENVFEQIGKKVKAFIDKIIAMVKGVIEKLKAFFYKFTGKTDKWLSVMKPRVNAASGRAGASEQEFEAHKWDAGFVNNDMVNAIDSIMDDVAAKSGDTFSKVEQAAAKVDQLKSTYMKDEFRDKTAEDSGVKGAIGDEKDNSGLAGELKKFEDKDTEAEADARVKKAANAFGVDEGSSLDDMWTNVTAKATGGEKVTMKVSEIGGGVDNMLKAIEGSKKAISNMQKAYDKHLKTLTNLRKKIENVYSKDSKVDKMDKFPTDLKAKYNSLISKLSTEATTELSAYEGIINTARGKNTTFMQNMCSEYMSIISKYANFKGKKDKD